MAFGKWLAIIGGLLAVIGYFVGSMLWLTLVGGILAVLGGFLK